MTAALTGLDAVMVDSSIDGLSAVPRHRRERRESDGRNQRRGDCEGDDRECKYCCAGDLQVKQPSCRDAGDVAAARLSGWND